MRVEARDIDHAELSRLLSIEYHLERTALWFLPKGEDAYGYLAEAGGNKYFVRLQPVNRSAGLEAALAGVLRIREKCEIPEIVAAVRTRHGAMTCAYRSYLVTLFPFAAGRTAWDAGITKAQLANAAHVLARIHDCDAAGLPGLPVEAFHTPFATAIRHWLNETASDARRAVDSPRREATELLACENDELLTTLDRLEGLGERLQHYDNQLVLTHGDPNLDNWILDGEDGVHLIDWGELALGPPERDLCAFAGEHFKAFLRAYASRREALKLSLEAFEFYFYRWTFQEIADYGSRVLADDGDAIEKEHAWAELQRYMPVRHRSIAEDLERLRCDAGEILGTSRVT